MSTIATTGPVDPPQTTTNIVGIKRIRKKVQLTAGVGQITILDIQNCLPLTAPEFRIMKMSTWASASAGSLLTVVFPLGTSRAFADRSSWTDEGTQGSIRPQIHLIPNFSFRNAWLQNSDPEFPGPVATFGGTATDLLVVDITLQYRTAIQSCPALTLACELMHSSDECDGTPPDDPDTSESESATYVDDFELR